MTRRRKPLEPTENEKEHAYVMHQKRGYGDKVQGDLAGFLDEQGEVGEVRERRREWARTHKDESTDETQE